MDQKDIIVAIDFGSARAGYAFSFPNNKNIYLCNFDKEKYKGKTINEIVLDDSDNCIEYGLKVSDYIKNGKLKNNEHFYERIKMNLYDEIYTIKASNSLKSINLVDLISKILEYLKKHAIEAITNITKGIQNQYNYDPKTNKIRWVLTVPAIWDEKNKFIMMMAAEKAGIVEDSHKNLFFALEPECASYYCLKEHPINNEIFDDSYIVCDLGAGTGDIICHQRIKNDGIEKIIEKTTPKGGALGSDEINKQFEKQVLDLLFGNDSISLIHENFKKSLNDNKNMKKFSSRYINLKRSINEFKESLDQDCLDQSYEIDCSIFFKINENLNMQNIVEEYNKKCKNDWKITDYGIDEDDKNICFPYKIIYDLIKETVDKVTNILLDIISEVDDVATIFYVGGFCNSKFVLEMIKNNIQSKYPKINHISSPEPDNSILKGAVLYGLSPERIKSRKSKYTLGIQAGLIWDSKFNKGGIKYYDEIDGVYRCKNGFYNFISKNDDIPYDNCLIRPLKLNKIDDNYLGGGLFFYKTYKYNPLFIDEEGVEELGKFELKVPIDKGEKGQIFFITMEMGGTFLNVSAFHKESNTRVNMEFKY